MALLPPRRVKEENLRFYYITRVAYMFGLLGHGGAVFSFWMMGIPEMALFNLVVSVPSFIAALLLNRLGHHNLAFSFAFFELYLHQLVGTYFLGWDFGFHYWLIYLAGLCFFNPYWKGWVDSILLAVVSLGYIWAFFFAHEGVYEPDARTLHFASLGNAVSAIAALSLLIRYFSTTTLRAEQKLKMEKAITEQQNEQLSAQHEALVIEQDKTSRMLNKVELLFGQQVSEEIAREMIYSQTEIDSKTFDATIMFLDIRDFTLFADSREPSEVARFQNIVFGELIEIVRKQKGVVLQILGDGIMAVFGAPVQDSKHARHAVQAGFDILEKVKELSEKGKIPAIRIGMGLNSGNILAGNVGNETRKFYSLTGKNVIIAARIEQLNKQYNSQFLVSESVFELTQDTGYQAEGLGEVHLKGIEKSVGLYKLA